MKLKKYILHGSFLTLSVAMLGLMGCGSRAYHKPDLLNKAEAESMQDVQEALGSVTEVLSGQPVSPEDLRRLAVDIQQDGSTRTAVDSVTTAIRHQGPVAKYCPTCGQRFSVDRERCPQDSSVLNPVEE